jgi:RimJ/RimL family protein N-acetyltransferase
MATSDLTFRPLAGGDELNLFLQLPYVLNEELADDLTAGRRRPEWMWVALQGNRLLARLAWWTHPGGDAPSRLDVLDIDESIPGPDRVVIGIRLVQSAWAATLPESSRPPDYGRFVPPDWREQPLTKQAVQVRMTILERTGARLLVERLRLEWRPGTPIAGPGRRLAFRPVHSGEELIGLMTSALDGTLDVHSRDDLGQMTAREAAVNHFEREFARYTSPREWWRVATLPDGQAVGFVIPARNPYNPIIAYLAVLPAHRGHGFVDDILAEGTRILADQDVPRIRASTDVGNVPMADAFQRAGYVAFEREIVMTWR